MDYNDLKVKQAAEVVQSFVAISKTLTKFTMQNAADLGLTLPQMGILNTINSFPELTLKEITDKLQLSKSTVSVNIDGLVNLGLIERKTNVEDRREIQLTTTIEGQKLSIKSSQNPLSYRAMALALENLPKEDIQALLRINEELLTHLQKLKL